MGIPKITIIPESIQLLRISDEEYFGPLYRDYLSNSKLKLINPAEGGSEELFTTGIKPTFSDSFEVGTAVHAMLLQPESFFISDLHKPSGKLGVWMEYVLANRQKGLSIKASTDKASIQADYYSSKFTATRFKTAVKNSLGYYLQRIHNKEIYTKEPIYLSEANAEKYEASITGALENKDFIKLLHPEGLLTDPETFNEYAILCEILVKTDEYSIILKAKAKLDNFTVDFDESLVTLNDLKTTGKPVAYFMGNMVSGVDISTDEPYTEWMDGSFQKFHYSRQMGMYLWMLQCYLMKTHGIVFKSKANMLVVETIPNFSSKVCHVSNAQIQQGLKEMKELLILVANLKWKETK